MESRAMPSAQEAQDELDYREEARAELEARNAESSSSVPDQNVHGFIPKAKRAASILGEDIKNLPGKVGGAIVKGLDAAPSELYGAGEQFAYEPNRAYQNMAIGAYSIPQFAMNAPSNVGRVLQHYGLQQKEDVDKIPRAPNLAEDLFGQNMGEQKPGDTLLQNAPVIAEGVHSGGEGMARATNSAVGAVGNLVSGKNKYAALKEKLGITNKENELKAAQDALDKVTEEHRASVNSEKEAKATSYQNGVGTTNPDKMIGDINQHEQTLKDLNQNITGLNHQMENVPKPTTLPEADTTPQETAQAATAAREGSAQNVTAAQDTHDAAVDNLSNINHSIGEHLNRNAVHDVRASEAIDETLKANKDEIGKGFQNLIDDFKNREVKIDNTSAIDKKTQDLMDLVTNHQAHSKEALQLFTELDDLKKQENPNAADYLTAYQAASQYAREARSKAYQTGMNAEERAAWKQKYEELDDKVDEMGKSLEESVGKENFQELKGLRSRYRNEVVPLFGNSIYQKLHKYNQMSGDIIKSLRGDKEPGNVIIKNVIKNNPEILKNAVGQRFNGAKRPEEILNPNEEMKKYIDRMPELQQLTNQHKAAKETIDNANKTLKAANENHNLHMQREKQAYDEAKEKQKERGELEKNTSKENAALDMQRNYLQKELTSHYNKVKALQEKIPVLNTEIKRLKEAAANSSLNLEQKFKAEKLVRDKKTEIDEANNQMKDANFGYHLIIKKLEKVISKIPYIRKNL